MMSSISSTDISLFLPLRQETTDCNLHDVNIEHLRPFDQGLHLDILINMVNEALRVDEEQHLHGAVITPWSKQHISLGSIRWNNSRNKLITRPCHE
jgi:hypothetical protein